MYSNLSHLYMVQATIISESRSVLLLSDWHATLPTPAPADHAGSEMVDIIVGSPRSSKSYRRPLEGTKLLVLVISLRRGRAFKSLYLF